MTAHSLFRLATACYPVALPFGHDSSYPIRVETASNSLPREDSPMRLMCAAGVSLALGLLLAFAD